MLIEVAPEYSVIMLARGKIGPVIGRTATPSIRKVRLVPARRCAPGPAINSRSRLAYSGASFVASGMLWRWRIATIVCSDDGMIAHGSAVSALKTRISVSAS